MYNFKHDSSKFKLQITNIRYFINEVKRTVTVTAEVGVRVPEFIASTIDFMQLPNGFLPAKMFPFGGVYGHGVIRMQWTAKCAPDDEWDVEKGKKIALAKLEANAYKRFEKSMYRWVKAFRTFADDVVTAAYDFGGRALAAAEHDVRYIQSIAQ
jgi:hypothetical protein